jgi:hypothetical protein
MSARTPTPSSPVRSRLSQSFILIIFLAVFTALAMPGTPGYGGELAAPAGDTLVDVDHPIDADGTVASILGRATRSTDEGSGADVSHGSWPAVTLLAALRRRTRGS